MEETVRNLIDMFVEGGVKFIIALIIIAIGFWLSSLAVKIVKKGRGFNRIDKTVQSFVLSFISITGKVLTLIISAGIVGIPTTSIITIIGSCGVAIGLALQGGLSNIAGGIMILLFKPFEVGDYINASSCEGTVLNINLFYTEIITVDNKKISLPNGTLSNNSITNYSALEFRKVNLKFSASYDSDIDKVKKVINDVISKEELIIHDKDILVKVFEHQESAIIYLVRAYVKTPDYWEAYYRLQENIKKAFDKNKIEIPYNKLDVHIEK